MRTPKNAAADKKRPVGDALGVSAADRKKQILKAAIEVFAERGFHKTRVSDIARRAGVAYGLIYHYFDSKDAVLSSVFEESWAIFLKVLREIAQAEGRVAAERLTAIADLLIDALRINPALIQVIIQEVSRSDRYVHPRKVEAFQEAFSVIRGIISEGQQRGELRSGFDPQVGAYIFFGALETICTGFLLKTISCATDADAMRLKQSVANTLLHGMEEPKSARRTRLVEAAE